MSSSSRSPLPGRFEAHFGDLSDPRVHRTKRYPLTHVLFMAFSAVLAGCQGWDEIALFASERRDFFEKFFALPHGTPCADTFRRVFEALRAKALAERFAEWVETLHGSLAGQLVALDGKAVRGAFDHAARTTPLHLLQAWAVEQKLVLAHEASEGAPGELAAAERLLDLLALEGAVVTGDANFCTQALAARVVGEGADYIFTLKGNRGPICAETKQLFERKRAHADRQSGRGHGRRERRVVRVLSAELLPIERRQRWAGLQALVQVERRRTVEATGESSVEKHYYLSSLPPDSERLAALIRKHWSIENQLHFVLDSSLREDACRVRDANSAENLALLRRMSLNLLRRPGAGSLSVPLKQRKATLSQDYLFRLLTLGAAEPKKPG